MRKRAQIKNYVKQINALRNLYYSLQRRENVSRKACFKDF